MTECARVLHETLLIPVLTYGCETILWKKERFRIGTVQRDNLGGLLGIRRMDKVPKSWIKELCGATKGVDERIDEGVLQWFGYVVKKDRIAKRAYVGKCAGSRSVGRRGREGLIL